VVRVERHGRIGADLKEDGMWTAGFGRAAAVIAVIGLVTLPRIGAAQGGNQAGAPAGDVVGVGTFIHIVADLDRTVAFYSALLGVKPNGDGMPRPYAANQPVATMYNTPGSKFRGATFNLPNSDLGLEFIDWESNRSPGVKARVFDPGAPVIVLQVRNLEAGLAAVTQHGGSFVTPDGKPVRIETGRFPAARLIMLRDPDGYFIELIARDQPPDAPEPGNVAAATFRYTAVAANQAAHFFEAAFGFKVNEASDFTDDPVLGGMMGLGTVQQRFANSTVPGSTLPLQFAEYNKLQGTKVDQALPRPGASMLRLMVRDLDASLAKAKAAGATGNNPPVTLTNGRRMAVVSSPDGLLLQLAEAAR
jgi:catechol 2,3-dioxygenase-like lactoylglutathione lyase family enzyme